jgi:hypothetical protein
VSAIRRRGVNVRFLFFRLFRFFGFGGWSRLPTMLPRHRILWDTKPKASDIEDDLDSPTEGLNVDLSKYPHFVPQPKWLKWQDNPPLAEYSLGGNNHERPLTDEELVQAIREQRERNKANLSEHDTIRPLPRIDIQTTEHRAFQDNFFQRGLYNNFLVMYFGGFLGSTCCNSFGICAFCGLAQKLAADLSAEYGSTIHMDYLDNF